VRRRSGEAFLPNCIVPTVKYGGGSVMIWGCMAAEGPGEMFLCEGRLNSKKYIEVLEACYNVSLEKIFKNEDKSSILFQQDNAPCHTALHTKEWFLNNHIKVLDWPAQSPDLNPIEHLWAMLKKRIKRHGVTSKKNLIEVIAQEWAKITQTDCEKLVGNMVQRIKAVINAKGGATKY
jgi:DDE superfamily endonuclease